MTLNAAQAVLGPALERGLAEQPALIGTRGTLTYAQVRDGAGRCANALAALGVALDQRVLLLLRDSPALACAYLGVMAAGAVAVTLNLRSSDAEVAHVLRDSACRLVLLDSEFAPLWQRVTQGAPPCPAYTLGGAAAGLPAWEAQVAAASPRFDPVPRAETDMAFWIYTSGTTGEMKACIHRQQDVLLADAYLRETLGVQPGMRLFATSKLFFAYALGTCLFGALRIGATSILLDAWPTPENVAAVLARHRPHVVFSVPAFYRALLAAGTAGQPGVAGVRTWVSAGERLPANVFERWRQATGGEIVEGMGASETIYMILTHRPGAARAGSSGRPAPGVEVRLLDEAGQPVPTGAPGVMWVRMQSASAAYWNRPQRSAAAFRDGWFVTGDVYTVDAEGFWHHGGRLEDRIPVPGGSVNPVDIEEAVQALPGVADASLVLAAAGNDPTPAMFVVATAEAERAPLATAIRAEIARRLPPPIPAAAVHWAEALPRTASGKVQRYRLRHG